MRRWLITLIAIVLIIILSIALISGTSRGSHNTLQPAVPPVEAVQPGNANPPGAIVEDQPNQLPANAEENTQPNNPQAEPDLTGPSEQPPVPTEPDNFNPTPPENGQTGQPPVTSGDDIDPNECSLVHNINACN